MASNSRRLVPELTRNVDIKLNSRAALQRHRHRLTSSRRTPPHPQVRPQGQSRQAIIFRLAALLGLQMRRRLMYALYLTSVVLASAGWLWLIVWVVRQMI